MFQIPKTMKDYWQDQDEPKASAADIDRIEKTLGQKLATPYVEFVTTYGFVCFDDVSGMRRLFDYIVTFADRKETRNGDIAFLNEPDRMLKAHDILTSPQAEDDDEFPKIPTGFLPIGNDLGQGQILLEMHEEPGRIWFWPYNEWPWGVEHNTWLGFVAENMYDFINNLRE